MMRLLDTETVQPHDAPSENEDLLGSSLEPDYAILSHRWQQGEISYQDVRLRQNIKLQAGRR